jgi:hypothetical protein
MTVVFVAVLITFLVLLIVLWNKVLRQEEIIRETKEEVRAARHEVRTIYDYLRRSDAPPAGQTITTDRANPVPNSGYAQRAPTNTPEKPEKAPARYPYPAPPTIDADEPYPEPKAKPRTLESYLGRNVLGIAASILVFVGLIFLGTLIYKHITDDMKIFGMYALSTLVTGLGIVLTVKKRNNFTDIFVGCGCGSFFISILLTHIYFNRISDLLAFSLLLIWMAAVLYLSKVLNATLLSIVAHIGMIISICFAFGLGLSDEKLLILLIYQAASIAVILLGNIFCCKKTYHFGVFVSLFLTIVASGFMWGRFTANPYQAGSFPFATTLPTTGLAAAFAAQFLCASFLSYLLSVSANRLNNESYRMLAHVSNKALWLAALIMNVYHVTYRISAGMTANSASAMTANSQLAAVFTAVMICIAIILVHAALTLLCSLKLNLNRTLETYSVLFLGGVASVLLLILWSYRIDVATSTPRITGLVGISLLLLLAKRITRNKAYAVGANLILAIDSLFMLFDGYRCLTDFGTIALSIGYMLLYIGIIWGQWLLQNEEDKAKYSVLVRLGSLLLIETSLISIFLTAPFKYHTAILLLLLTALNLLFYLVRYDRNADKRSALYVSMFVNTLVLLAFDAGFIAFAYKDATSTIVYLLLFALALGLSFIRINEVFDGSDNNMAGILTGIKLTVLVLATVYGTTAWFDQAYCFSIICMLTALICIILGLVGRVKSLRLYGLVLTLVCVLKLVTYDVANLNTPLRVVSLIGGGVICFIISAIYTYTTKKFCYENSTVKEEE